MAAGAVGNLWKLLFKLNVADVGFNESWHILGATSDEARTKATAIATARRRILPSDSEIYYATISNDDSKRDSKYVPSSLGAGLFALPIVAPAVVAAPSVVNDARTAIRIRFEHDGGGEDTRLLVGVGDTVVTSNDLVAPPTDLTAVFAGADPDAGDLTVFKTQLENFIKIISKYAVHVVSGHAPGGAYTTNVYTSAFYRGIGKKKGGRVSI
jgi:hypothetical protein